MSAAASVSAPSIISATARRHCERSFSERYYGRFERRIPIEDVDEDKVFVGFKNGVLTVTMPKAPQAKSKVKRIAINGK